MVFQILPKALRRGLFDTVNERSCVHMCKIQIWKISTKIYEHKTYFSIEGVKVDGLEGLRGLLISS